VADALSAVVRFGALATPKGSLEVM